MKDIKKLSKYFCYNPFIRLELYPNDTYTCCTNWIKMSAGKTNNLKQILKNDELNKLRESVLDGTFKYCNENECPNLSRLIYEDTVDYPIARIDTIKNKDEFIKNSKISNIKISLDRTCNLTCPSCRTDLIINDGVFVNHFKNIINDMTEVFGDDINVIDISGSGEPFASSASKDFLFNFDIKKFPKLNTIGLHTNATLLDENTWNKMINIHKYIKKIEISIDAATEETYKIVRRGGNWKKLIENIKFLASIPTIENTTYLFVVQYDNYKEMSSFVQLINSIPHANTYSIFFNKIHNWGSFTDDIYKQKKIWDESHPEFNDFLIELKKIVSWEGDSVKNDMNNLIDKYSLLGKRCII